MNHAGASECAPFSSILFNISHNLNNSFSSIFGFSEMLMNNEDLLVSNYGNYINTSAQDVYGILEGVIAFIGIQNRFITHAPCAVSAGTVIYDALTPFRNMIQEKNITVFIDAEADLRIFADAEMIMLALGSVIKNALIYSPDGSSVCIIAEHSGSGAEIRILDQGQGMSREILDSLFEIQLRDRTVKTAASKAMGLGLHISRDLIARNGGTIRVESELGCGTTVTIALPTAEVRQV